MKRLACITIILAVIVIVSIIAVRYLIFSYEISFTFASPPTPVEIGESSGADSIEGKRSILDQRKIIDGVVSIFSFDGRYVVKADYINGFTLDIKNTTGEYDSHPIKLGYEFEPNQIHQTAEHLFIIGFRSRKFHALVLNKTSRALIMELQTRHVYLPSSGEFFVYCNLPKSDINFFNQQLVYYSDLSNDEHFCIGFVNSIGSGPGSVHQANWDRDSTNISFNHSTGFFTLNTFDRSSMKSYLNL